MKLLKTNKSFALHCRKDPELFRDQFPYSEIPLIKFDNQIIPLSPVEKNWITDTTFRDLQLPLF